MVERLLLQMASRLNRGHSDAPRRLLRPGRVGLSMLVVVMCMNGPVAAANPQAPEPAAGIGLRAAADAGAALRAGIQFGDWGTRVGLVSQSSDPSLSHPVTTRLSWQWLGDYRFAPAWGLRATGGLLGRLEAGTSGSALQAAGGVGALRVGGGRSFGLIDSAASVAGGEGAWTTPYLGLGYDLTTRLRNGWGGLGLSADLGLISRRSPGGAGLRVNGEAYEEGARGLRVAPVFQLGVSYSF